MKRVYKEEISSGVNLDEIPDENKHGDCFVVALNTFLEDPNNYVLVHGVVAGQGPLEGVEYCHAWVIDDETVIDNTIPQKRIPVGLYYYIGKISITREYDKNDVMKMLDKYGTYGPWDPVFRNYP